jgi:hypothetical protein
MYIYMDRFKCSSTHEDKEITASFCGQVARRKLFITRPELTHTDTNANANAAEYYYIAETKPCRR